MITITPTEHSIFGIFNEKSRPEGRLYAAITNKLKVRGQVRALREQVPEPAQSHPEQVQPER